MRVLSNPAVQQFVVQNREYPGIVIRQQARFTRIEINQAPDGTCDTKMFLTVTPHHAEEDGSLGAALPALEFPPRPVILVADNNTAVSITADPLDPAFGALRYIKLQDATDAEAGLLLNMATGQLEPLPPRADGNAWHLFVEDHVEPLALQGDAFRELMKHPQVIEQLIAQHVAAADAMGRFA